MESGTPTWLHLYAWRQRVAGIYQERSRSLRAGEDPGAVCLRFRARKDELFRDHPQSPLPSAARRVFAGLAYFPYDPTLCVEGLMEPEPVQASPTPGPLGDAFPLRRAARLLFALGGTPLQLIVYWIDVYGGGLFLPFRDATAATESYGGGRYLFDTVKGSDFLALDGAGDDGPGVAPSVAYAGGRVLLDFNYAYNPSCAYDARWACPLAPRENWLPIAIRAGERRFLGNSAGDLPPALSE